MCGSIVFNISGLKFIFLEAWAKRERERERERKREGERENCGDLLKDGVVWLSQCLWAIYDLNSSLGDASI